VTKVWRERRDWFILRLYCVTNSLKLRSHVRSGNWGSVAEDEDVDYARSITASGVLVTICLHCEHTMVAKEVGLLLLAEHVHSCFEKQAEKKERSQDQKKRLRSREALP
jgi:hypothetical protein